MTCLRPLRICCCHNFHYFQIYFTQRFRIKKPINHSSEHESERRRGEKSATMSSRGKRRERPKVWAIHFALRMEGNWVAVRTLEMEVELWTSQKTLIGVFNWVFITLSGLSSSLHRWIKFQASTAERTLLLDENDGGRYWCETPHREVDFESLWGFWSGERVNVASRNISAAEDTDNYATSIEDLPLPPDITLTSLANAVQSPTKWNMAAIRLR